MTTSIHRKALRTAKRAFRRAGRPLTYRTYGAPVIDKVSGSVTPGGQSAHSVRGIVRALEVEELVASAGLLQAGDVEIMLPEPDLSDRIGRPPEPDDEVVVDGLTYRILSPLESMQIGDGPVAWTLKARRAS